MRALVVSDIHGNIEALRAVARVEPDADLVLCLGDIVDYGPRPEDTVAWVMANARATVRGNHDHAVATGADCRSAPLFRRLSVESRARTLSLLFPRSFAFLRSLPSTADLVLDGLRVKLLHAAPEDPLYQYLPASDVEGWRAATTGLDADLVLVGHTHLPACVELGGIRMANPGSVGLPRDGDARACYAVIDRGDVQLKRVAYDVDRTIEDLRKWGLPGDVTETLESLYRGGTPASPFTGGARA